jgi:REP element-mobilizing transposase RayT
MLCFLLVKGNIFERFAMDNRYSRHNRRKYSLKVHIVRVTKYRKQILSKQYWKKKIFWSDGYFACSIGEVSSATIQKYIENQG